MNQIQIDLLSEILSEASMAVYHIWYLLVCFIVGVGSFVRAGNVMPEDRVYGYYFMLTSIACGLSIIRVFFDNTFSYVPEVCIYNTATFVFWYEADVKVWSILGDDWRKWILEEHD